MQWWRNQVKSWTFDPSEIEEAVAFAKQEFCFGKRSKDGSTLKDQLNSVWRQTGIKPKELEDLVELPESCFQVWKWFIDLHNARGSNGFGVNPIPYSEIKAYFDLIDVQPEDWEVTLIKLFDNEALSVYAKEAEAERKKSSKK